MLKKFDLMYEEFKKGEPVEVLEEAVADWSMEVVHTFEEAKKYATDTKWSFAKDEKYVDMYKPIVVVANSKTNKKYACALVENKFVCTDEEDKDIKYKQFINMIPKTMLTKIENMLKNKVEMIVVNDFATAKQFKKCMWGFSKEERYVEMYKPIVVLVDERTNKKYAMAKDFNKISCYDEKDFPIHLDKLERIIPKDVMEKAKEVLAKKEIEPA